MALVLNLSRGSVLFPPWLHSTTCAKGTRKQKLKQLVTYFATPKSSSTKAANPAFSTSAVPTKCKNTNNACKNQFLPKSNYNVPSPYSSTQLSCCSPYTQATFRQRIRESTSDFWLSGKKDVHASSNTT